MKHTSYLAAYENGIIQKKAYNALRIVSVGGRF
jgi:hypothetical protein